MRKFYQNKLWRSKLIAQREAMGAIVHVISLSEAEYNEELGLKMLEEANEAFAAQSHDELKDEIADMLEAIDCLLALHNIEKDEIIALQDKKRIESGSYTDRRLVDYVQYPVGSKEEKHCLENSEKYPELCDEEDEDKNNCCLK